MTELKDVPIFPLPLVVCPSELVPLHIFEERYKEMIALCRERQAAGQFSEFGIFYYEEGTLHETGCLVRIDAVLKEFENGELDILTIGQRRARIRTRKKDHAYDTADLEPVQDTTPDWDETLATEAFNLHKSLLQLTTGEVPADALYDGRAALSFYLAQTSALAAGQKQELLDMHSEDQRLTQLISHLRERVAILQHTQQILNDVRNHWNILKEFRKRKDG